MQAAVRGQDLAQETERGQGRGLVLRLQGPPGPVAVALVRLRERPEVLSDLALTDLARRAVRRAVSGGMPVQRRAPRPEALPATAPAGGPGPRTDRRLGRAPACRRAGLVQLQVRPARLHGPTASASIAPVGVPEAAGPSEARAVAVAKKEQA